MPVLQLSGREMPLDFDAVFFFAMENPDVLIELF